MRKPETTTSRTLAKKIAYKIFQSNWDAGRRDELEELLIKFADEIQRSAIEP